MFRKKTHCGCGMELTEDGYCFDCHGEDAHDCYYHANSAGYCEYCDYIIPGSYAYREHYGGE